MARDRKTRKQPPSSLSTRESASSQALPAWSKDERWAWEQICQHLNVDFDEKEANNVADDTVGSGSPKHDEIYQQTLRNVRARNTNHPEKLAKDGSRRLSGHFLARFSETWN